MRLGRLKDRRAANAAKQLHMEPTPTHRVVGVEGLGGGIFVQFSNGEAALYSAALLHSFLDQAFVLRGGIAAGEPMGEAELNPKAIQKPN